jgi:hypothetical protein
VNGTHTLGVLRGECSNSGHAKAAQGRKGFQVSLYARAAATVGPGDGQHARELVGEGGGHCHIFKIDVKAAAQ